MALVGDVILSARELMTDLPQLFPAPQLSSATPSPGTLLNPATWYVVITIVTPFGESLPSNELPVTLTPGNQNITVNFSVLGFGSLMRAVRIYIGTASGQQNEYSQITASASPATLSTGTMVATPPSRATAYLPDTDGAAVSAYAIYRWLNQALAWAAGKNHGGLPDFGAVGTINGQPNYVMPGYWKKIDSAWFDGYPLGLLVKNNVFRRNPVPGYSDMLIVFQATDRLMVEAWPQPNRDSAQSFLASPISATDTTATLDSTAAYVLGFGMTQIGSEIVNYAAIDGNTLTGLQRGMCGTVPVAHSFGETTTELNLMIAGYRVPSTYAVGQAATTLYLPPGWDEALTSYMLYRFRKAEQDEAGAKAALSEATQKMSDLSANRIIAGPRQIQPYAAIGPEVGAGLGTAFGGVIIP